MLITLEIKLSKTQKRFQIQIFQKNFKKRNQFFFRNYPAQRKKGSKSDIIQIFIVQNRRIDHQVKPKSAFEDSARGFPVWASILPPTSNESA